MNNEEIHDVKVCHATSDLSLASHKIHSLSIILSKFISYKSIVARQISYNKSELQNKLSIHCMYANKEFTVTMSTTQRYKVICFENACKWHMHEAKLKNEEIFVIKYLIMYIVVY